MSLKMEFVEKASKQGANVAGLCREFGISRQTGYKWLGRYRETGSDGLEEQSRRPTGCPLATAEEIVLALLELREAHPNWGPKKLVLLLAKRFGPRSPSRATAARILRRFGQIRARKRRSVMSVVEQAPVVEVHAPNDLWTADFKGWWRTRDGSRCEPLTIRDAHSRFVLAVKSMSSAEMESTRGEFERVFRKFGVPKAIQFDNGQPFVSVQSRGGLSRLSAWFVSLGIRIVRSRPACPQDNGGHERMHRDIRADVQGNPGVDRFAEQRALDRWKQEFNHVRPHEALDGKTPAEVYRPAERRSLRPVRWKYPPDWITRRVYAPMGRVSVNSHPVVIGKPLIGYDVALEPVDDVQYRIWFTNLDLGLITCEPTNSAIKVACVRFLNRPKRRRAA